MHIFSGKGPWGKRMMIDATYLKSHCVDPAQKVDVPHNARTRDRLICRLYPCDGKEPPIITLLSEGQMSAHDGATRMLDACRRSKSLYPMSGLSTVGATLS